MKHDDSLTSLTLIERAVDRCDVAWAEMVRTYYPLICYWTRNAGLNQHDSENVCQEVFLRLFRFLSRFQPTRQPGAFRGWLKTIVRHAMFDYRQRQEFQSEGHSFFESLAANSNSSLSDQTACQMERSLILKRVLELVCAEFSAQHAQAFRMVVLEQIPVEVVAEQLGISRNVVYQAKSRILNCVRRKLNDLNEAMDE